MTTFKELWQKFARSKEYREEFVAAQVKRGVPFQIRALMKQQGITQEILADRAGLKQGVVSRAANPEYGNLTLNTLIRVAAGFDVALILKFVPFSELNRWFTNLSEETMQVKTFEQENEALEKESGASQDLAKPRRRRFKPARLRGSNHIHKRKLAGHRITRGHTGTNALVRNVVVAAPSPNFRNAIGSYRS